MSVPKEKDAASSSMGSKDAASSSMGSKDAASSSMGSKDAASSSTGSKDAASSSTGSKDETITAQQLKMQFHGTRKGDSETIKSYAKNLKCRADSLAAIGSPISDPDLVLQLLAGLPPQYLLLKNTISSQLPLPNFSEACSMLYEYEKKTSTPNTPPRENQSANNNNSSKSTVEMIHDIASTVTAVASIAREFWNALGPWSTGTAAKAKAKAGQGNSKKYYKKGHNSGGGGRGNNTNKRGGGGPSTRNTTNGRK